MKSSVIARGILATGFVMGLLISGCSSSDDASDSPVTACKKLEALICNKVYGCFTTDQINPDTFGNNESDCKTKLTGNNCTEQKLKCDSGKSFQSSAAKECLDQFDAFSCDQLQNSPAPAACNEDQLCQ